MGIHDGHNSSASLFVDGNIAGLLQEERLRGIKNYSGFPIMAIKKLLQINKFSIEDIDYFALNGLHIPKPSSRLEKIEVYKNNFQFKGALKHLFKSTFIYDIYKNNIKNDRIENLLELGVTQDKIEFVEHHLAHAYTAYFGCPWVNFDDRILILTQDGSGDELSGTVNIGHKGKIERIASIKKEDSLGRIYATATFMLGMVPLEHEYKLMGMAPYSPEKGKNISYQVFKNLLEFPEDNSLIWQRGSGLPPMQRIYPHLRKQTEFQRFDWIAAGLQKFTEEMLTRWVKNCIKKTGIRKIVLSGGTFMNVKANQKIYNLPEVEELFIVPSCGDESNVIGAAYRVYNKLNPDIKLQSINHLYYGPDETGQKQCLEKIKEYKSRGNINFSYKYLDDIETKIAKLLSNDRIVARCKGPMEFGARALGNRSILCNAGDLDKIRIINNMIKKRDFWMPFAPVMLAERSQEYIKNPMNMDAKYMIITFDSTDKYKDFIGGVQQADKTARPQVINQKQNPLYYKILKVYEEITGQGVLINTSFNLHGLPIVYGPEEAMYVFENSGLRYLALGNYLVEKKD